jgi:hypothetical protein
MISWKEETHGQTASDYVRLQLIWWQVIKDFRPYLNSTRSCVDTSYSLAMEELYPELSELIDAELWTTWRLVHWKADLYIVAEQICAQYQSLVFHCRKSSGSGTGSTQPREYNWGAIWKKRSGSGLENREYGRRDPSRWPSGTLYPQKLAITSPTSGGRSVRSRTQTMELFFFLVACKEETWLVFQTFQREWYCV